MSRLVSTIFHDRGAANAAVDELMALGYQATQINVALNPHIHRQVAIWRDGEDASATEPVDSIDAIVRLAILRGAVTGAIAGAGIAGPILVGPLATSVSQAESSDPQGDAFQRPAWFLERELRAGAIIVAVDTGDVDRALVRNSLAERHARQASHHAEPTRVGPSIQRSRG